MEQAGTRRASAVAAGGDGAVTARAGQGPKVCHVTTAHPADDSRVFWRECVGLASQGYRVVLIARADADGLRHGVKIVALPTYRRRLVRMTVGVATALRLALRANADLYHLHDPELVPMLVVLRLLRKRVVYDAHEWLSKQVDAKPYVHGRARAAARLVARGVERTVNSCASKIITVNEACAAIYRPDKVRIVANFPDHHGGFQARGPRADTAPASDGDGRDSGVPRFVYVGGISRVRGIVEQVAAMGELNAAVPARLTLMGAFEDAALKEHVSSLPGWDYVDYLGPVPHAEVAGHLVGALAGIATLLPTPNHLISSPVKVFEYLACGLPVILSDFPAWRRMLAGVDAAVFVDPADPRAIAAAMRALIDSPTRALAMGAAGRTAVDETFNWTTQLAVLVAAYREIGVSPA